jgi:hypothetical protein
MLCFRVEQADGFDVFLQPRLAQLQHLLGGIHLGKQRFGGFVHPHIRCLCRTDNRHKQAVGVGCHQLGFRVRFARRKMAEDRLNRAWGECFRVACHAPTSSSNGGLYQAKPAVTFIKLSHITRGGCGIL